MAPESRTIFALSSGQGRAGVAVIRVSGAAAGCVLDRMAAPRPRPRFAGLRRLRNPESGEVLDQALVLWFPGPASETGEDMAELQIHGGSAVIRAVLSALGAIPGCRPAGAGEFARRAFENGKLDLTAAEGLADLVDAETEEQRRQALVQAGGALAAVYARWREQLLEARALVEAAIDFSDEGDVAGNALETAGRRVKAVAYELQAHVADHNRGEIVRDGFQVVIAGPPNAGKSSLVNALARREVAIVSPEAGTTRDVLEVRLDLGGYAVIIADTAGVREAEGAIEREGIRRTFERSRTADLVLWVEDATAAANEPPPEAIAAGRVLRVRNKIDLVRGAGAGGDGRDSPDRVNVSAATGDGLTQLAAAIAREVELRIGDRDRVGPSRPRHREHLEACLGALTAFGTGRSADVELRAEDLRRATDALGRLVGTVGVEEVLDQIFGRFCIGK